jgi:hypothetical protein
LDEFREVPQPHRTHAIRLPNGPAPGVARPPRQVTDTILRPTAFSPMK